MADATTIAEVKSALDDARRAHDDNGNAWVMMAMHGEFGSLCSLHATAHLPRQTLLSVPAVAGIADTSTSTAAN